MKLPVEGNKRSRSAHSQFISLKARRLKPRQWSYFTSHFLSPHAESTALAFCLGAALVVSTSAARTDPASVSGPLADQHAPVAPIA
jgi:hypothetical protein